LKVFDFSGTFGKPGRFRPETPREKSQKGFSEGPESRGRERAAVKSTKFCGFSNFFST
jgi:hypothetical protein